MVITLHDLINNIDKLILDLQISLKLKNHNAFETVINEIKNILFNLDVSNESLVYINNKKNTRYFNGIMSNGNRFNLIIRNDDTYSFNIQFIFENGETYSYKIKKTIKSINELNFKISIESIYENPCLYFDKYTSKAYWSSNSYWTHTLDSNHESKVYNKNGVMIEKKYKEIDSCSYNFGYRDSTKVSYDNLLSRMIRIPLSTKIEQSENNYNKMILLHRNKVDVAEYYCKNNDSEYSAIIPVSIEHGIANIDIKDENYFKENIISQRLNPGVKLQRKIMYR